MRKIAVFANGLNTENLMKFMKGIAETSKDGFADYHVFLGHDSYENSKDVNSAEWCIYSLPNLKDYDGAVIFGPGMNYETINKGIVDRCIEAGIPTICISNKYEGTIRIYTDNYEGMKLVAEHMLDEHKIRSAVFIAGPKDNEESNERLRAVRDAFAIRDIPFDDSCVFYSNWVAYLSTDFVKRKYLSSEGLPDVIFCANDVTAVFVCFVLEDLGVKCPEDVLVTGFDGDYQTMNFYPSITTAVQPFYEMGVKTVECFEDILSGKPIANEFYIPCTFRMAESCGCDTSERYDEYRRLSCVRTHKNTIMNDLHMSRIKDLTDAAMKSESYSTIGMYLQEFFYNSDGFEGNPFYVCMDPNFAKLSELEVWNLPRFKFNDYFLMLVGKNGKNKYNAIEFNTSQGLIPVEEGECKSHIYVFQPIYYKTFVGGYTIMADNIEYFGLGKYNFLHTHFNRLLDQYKKNMNLTYLNSKLSQLMNTDVLTSTKNRMAFEFYKQSLAEEIENGQTKDIAVIVADINNLKYINDNLGHECGDEYIKNASAFICNTYKHSPVFRMGGDEFFVVLKGEDFINRHKLADEMGNTMIELAKSDKDAIDKISIAFAIADYDSSIDNSIDDTIKRADDMMYENKRKYKLLLNNIKS